MSASSMNHLHEHELHSILIAAILWANAIRAGAADEQTATLLDKITRAQDTGALPMELAR
jgi:hypothetical protein